MSCNEQLEWTIFLLTFEIDSNVRSTFKDNLCATYHFKAFLLDEWETRLYAITPFRHLDIVNVEIRYSQRWIVKVEIW